MSLSKFLGARFATCVMGPIDRPIHEGRPNHAHGKFFLVGSVPASCCSADGRQLKYATEEEAIAAAFAGGAERVQKLDRTFAVAPTFMTLDREEV